MDAAAPRAGGPAGRTRGRLAWLGLVAVAVLLPLLVRNKFVHDVMILTLLWAGIAGAWNIAGGYAGQISLGHAAFFGLGAYTSSLLYVDLGLTPWAGMLAGALLAAVFAALLSAICLRLRGPFFILATLAFAEVARIVALNWRSLTRGSEGLEIMFQDSPAHFMFKDKLPYTYLALLFAAGILALCRALEGSRLGYWLRATREEEDAAEAMGIDTFRVKVAGMILSAALTALGGSFFAQYFLFLEPGHVFSFEISVQLPLICVVGGVGTALGPFLGALLIVPASELLRAWLGGAASGLYLSLYALLLITVVLFMPEGLVGRFAPRRRPAT